MTFWRIQTGRGFDSRQLHKENILNLKQTRRYLFMIMYKEKLALYIALITLTNGWVSTSFLKDKNIQLQSIVSENIDLKKKLHKYETEGMNVTVTMYEPLSYQTDSTPNILADGTRIRVHKASEYRYIAVSRNLLKRHGGWLDYGDFVLLKGTSHKDGVYQVRDTMNKRFVNRIDILESPGVTPYKFQEAQIVKTDLFVNNSNG
jgi:3D (Asp-Asp-Asp) domain-containing protein